MTTQEDPALAELLECWRRSPYPTTKISSYFPVYVDLFRRLRGTACTFVETGVLDGGSLFMWRAWLGDRARIIGIDLNPAAAKWREHGFEIHIGDQGDPAFWQKTLAEIGTLDVLLDDGGHQSFQQIVTVSECLKTAKKTCLIVVEDTATSFMRDFSRHGNETFLEYAKDATDVLIGRSASMYPGRFPGPVNAECVDLFKHVYSIQFFNGIVAFNLDVAKASVPEVVRNRPADSASDFRYAGRDSARVSWPNPFKAKQVTVKGGSNFSLRETLKKYGRDLIQKRPS